MKLSGNRAPLGLRSLQKPYVITPNGTPSTVAVDAEFLIALDPHERSITKFFIVRKPLERLKFAPARCKLFGFDSNPCRYPYLSKRPKLLPVLNPYEFLQFPESGRNFWDSFFDNWLVFGLGQQRNQPSEESLGRTGLQENAAGAGQVNDQPFTAQHG
jgi:hypothetical protein